MPAITAVSVHEPALAAVAHTVLGRKGLLAKDAATRLGLCAVHTALGLPPGRAQQLEGAAGTAVVVASNLGNVQAVCDIVTEVRERTARSVSPLQAPNASSNIIASSIAIRYGFTGPNIAVCSGGTAGLDAISLALLLLRSGRTHRAVVVGVEPDDPAAVALAGGALTAGAACVVLEPHDGGPAVLLDPVQRHRSAPAGEPVYGALGVVEVATAAAALADGGTASAVCGAPGDGYASVRLRRVTP